MGEALAPMAEVSAVVVAAPEDQRQAPAPLLEPGRAPFR